MPSRRSWATIGAVAAAGGVAAGVWAFVEPHRFTMRRVAVPVLAAGSTPRRILHLSDMHMSTDHPRMRRWIARLAHLEPDLVVVSGDFLAGPHAVAPVLDALNPLLDRPGVFVLGSNDYFAPKFLNPARYLRGPTSMEARGDFLPWPDLVGGLTKAGWADLSNKQALVELPGWTVAARGVDDPHILRDRYDLVAGPFPDGVDVRLGVTHAPYRRVLDAMVVDGADLILAGHTHGGQLRVPWLGPIVTNCDVGRKRARGLSDYSAVDGSGQHAWLHVSAGIGQSPYAPIRFNCPPEATLLTLIPRRG
ncbi:MAG: metallophosphoesterase [Candidatus Nanopelagicales bacterium]|nr:metallophosphoesterase [Candidatus Nanopelagicales bacterium]